MFDIVSKPIAKTNTLELVNYGCIKVMHPGMHRGFSIFLQNSIPVERYPDDLFESASN
jgi:hypothetical protein